eukprot:NODE_989_length_2510_cov_0.196429.p2 type:complete len:163 gc:universal NODE_989_length_2510_cov_0.196429:1694-2182(+)
MVIRYLLMAASMLILTSVIYFNLGNIWLLDDNKIGLIDYGQVKELNSESIEQIKQIYKGISTDDIELATKAYASMGFTSEKNLKNITFEKLVLLYDREELKYFGKMNFPQYMEHLEQSDKSVSPATNMIMVLRTSILLRGLAAMLTGKKVSTAEMWKEFYTN